MIRCFLSACLWRIVVLEWRCWVSMTLRARDPSEITWQSGKSASIDYRNEMRNPSIAAHDCEFIPEGKEEEEELNFEFVRCGRQSSPLWQGWSWNSSKLDVCGATWEFLLKKLWWRFSCSISAASFVILWKNTVGKIHSFGSISSWTVVLVAWYGVALISWTTDDWRSVAKHCMDLDGISRKRSHHWFSWSSRGM